MIPSWSEPRATSAIADIRGFIGMVLDNGHAYESGGAVYFEVQSWHEFGSISGYDRETMLKLAAEHGGNPDDPNKRDPLWTSFCGSRQPRASRAGIRCGAPVARLAHRVFGPGPARAWTPPSTSTVAAPI